MKKKALLLMAVVLLISGCRFNKINENKLGTNDSLAYNENIMANIRDENDSERTTTRISTTTKVPVTETTTAPVVNEITTRKVFVAAEVRANIESMKNIYPDGEIWDSSKSYRWKGGIYPIGYGSTGFAFLLSDSAFGEALAQKHTNFDSIKVGDIIRYLDDTHSVVVLEVTKKNVVVAEGGYDGVVKWGREIPISEIKETGTYIMTRW